MKTILLYIFLFIAFFATGIAQAKTYQIPVLTVRSSDNKGNFSRYEFKLEKTSDVKPAIIMVGDDTPGGAGAMQKSSIWLAASTAALQRNTSLKGVEITVKFSGHIDGPSAGAIICLAIMSALDDRDMPDDFAITGTIMPDGTIGHVGGVEKKILAAKEAGIKRICIPAGKRWYKDPKTNEEYDYKKIAEDNCLEFHEVDNIVQAYNIMHKLNGENQPYISERSISQLPPEIEKKVEEFYNQEVKSWHEIMRANVMGKSKSEIEKDPIFQTMAYGKSNKLRNKGRLLLAIREMRIPLAASKAYGDFAREIARIRARYTEYKKNKNSKINYLLDLISTAKHIFKKEYLNRRLTDNISLLTQNDIKVALSQDNYHDRFTPIVPGSDIPAQLIEVNRMSNSIEYLELFGGKTPSKQELQKANDKDLNESIVIWERALFLTYVLSKLDDVDAARFRAFAKCLPRMTVNPRANVEIIEHLFYTTATAASEMYRSTILNGLFEFTKKEMSSKLKRRVSDEEVSEFLLSTNIDIASWDLAMNDSGIMHNRKSKDFRDYHNVIAIKSHILFYTQSYALMNKFEDNEDISTLINHAKRQAMININKCKEKNIPCLQAVVFFEEAEYNRDQEGIRKDDKIRALVKYWNASLIAKSLEMSFAEKKSKRPSESVSIDDSTEKLNEAKKLYQEKRYRDAYLKFSSLGNNCKEARYYLGVFFLNGLGGVRKNLTTAEKHFSFALNSGYIPAYFQMGYLLNFQNKKKEAYEHFRDGAAKGDADCRWALGRFYYTGVANVVKQNKGKAIELLTAAAQSGHAQARQDLKKITR